MPTFAGGPGNDTFNEVLGDGYTFAFGGGGDDTLNIDWSAQTASTRLDGSPFVGSIHDFPPGPTFDFNGFQHLNVTFGPGDDQVFLSGGLSAAMTLTADGGGGQNSAYSDFSQSTVPVTILVGPAPGATIPGAGAILRNFNYGVQIYTGSGDDTMIGGSGDVYFNAGGGHNAIIGGAGNDQLYSSGIDTIDGGGGFNTLNVTADGVFNQISPTSYTVSNGTTAINIDHIHIAGSGVFNFHTLVGGDSIAGSGTLNLDLSSDSAPVSFVGGDSLPEFQSAAGYLDVTGVREMNVKTGAGDDSVSLFSIPFSLYAQYSGTFDGGGGHNSFAASYDSDPSAISFVLDETTGAVTAINGAQLSITNYQSISLAGGLSDDFIQTGDGVDALTGNGGDDTLISGAGNDVLDGGAGANLIDAGPGDDIIYWSGGADTIDGGSGLNLWDGHTFNEDLTYTLTSPTSMMISNGSSIQNVERFQLDFVVGGNTVLNLHALAALSSNFLTSGGSGVLDMDLSGTTDSVVVTQWGGDSLSATDMTTHAVTSASGFQQITILTGAGNDLVSGDAGDNLLGGGAGADTISGGGGNDTLSGGAGNDILDGGPGNDTASYVGAFPLFSANAVVVSLAIAGPQDTLGAGTDTLISIENLQGSAFNDDLSGDGHDNAIFGGDDNDTIRGQAGDDSLFGQNGNDYIEGGDGNDVIDGGTGFNNFAGYRQASSFVVVDLGQQGVWQDTQGAGNDLITNVQSLFGSAFNDTLTGDGQGDTIYAGNGADTVYGKAGNDLLFGEAGNDYIEGGDGDDTMDGGAGFNVLVYASASAPVVVNLGLQGAAQDTRGAGVDTFSSFQNLIGSAFDDDLSGDGQTNPIYGGAGNDTLRGQAGDDNLFGQEGSDYIEGGDDNDVIDGGAGFNVAAYATASHFVVVDLAMQGVWQDTQGAGNDLITNVENLVGSDFNDTLSGDGQTNVIYGRAGDDTLYGRAGDDNLFGQAGNDYIEGGDGNDVIDGGAGFNLAAYATASHFVVLDLGMQGQWQDAQGAGNDFITNVENLIGSDFDDNLTGDGLDNVIYGGNGNDTLYGKAGADNLFGGNGNDYIDGGTGNDILRGNSGSDAFVFGASFGHDTVTDFTAAGAGHDRILLLASMFADFAAVQSHMTQSGTDVVIADGLGDTLTLSNLLTTDLTAGDFTFV